MMTNREVDSDSRFVNYECDNCGHEGLAHDDRIEGLPCNQCDCKRLVPKYVKKHSESRSAEYKRRARSDPNRKELVVKISPELHSRLRVAADERMVSVNFLCNKAFEFYLDKLIPIGEVGLTRD